MSCAVTTPRHFNHSETPNTGNGCKKNGTENATICNL